ncbi:MAG: outer membrane beta-barrel protein [Armatimonadetes bacterium]|nr:outer membrane beta-barrel protein [Armatimonadota bacterium]
MKNSIFNAAIFAAVTVIGMTALVAVKPASAQTPINPILPVKNTKEISLDGNFQFDPNNDISLNVGLGYFLSPQLEVGGQIRYANPDSGDSAYEIIGAVDYHFPSQSPLLPFVGVFVGYADPGGSSDTFTSYGVRGGVKYFLNQNVSVNGILRYAATDQDNDESQFGLNLGLSVYLR